ncbi:hypothetical protein SGRIM128S_02213 [Streptomyces griseomycini]
MQAMVDAGQIQALELTDTDRANVGEAALEGVSIDGKVYAMPLDTQPEGIYYSKDLFNSSCIASTPTTMDELKDAVAKLKAIKVAPIAVGAKDAWPAAHWYYSFALRECSQETMQEAAKSLTFDDPCWTEAGEDLAELLETEPFQKGFLTASTSRMSPAPEPKAHTGRRDNRDKPQKWGSPVTYFIALLFVGVLHRTGALHRARRIPHQRADHHVHLPCRPPRGNRRRAPG